MITVSEGCEDNDALTGDGCDASCQVEPGWTCDSTVPVSFCSEACNNGVITPGE